MNMKQKYILALKKTFESIKQSFQG